jgi:hypothetical protein
MAVLDVVCSPLRLEEKEFGAFLVALASLPYNISPGPGKPYPLSDGSGWTHCARL